MKFRRFLRNITVRAAAFLVLCALSLSVMFYALGYFELPYIDRGNEETEYIPDVSKYEETIRQLESGQNISGIGAETTSSPAVTDTPATSGGEDTVPVTGASETTAETETGGSVTPPVTPKDDKYAYELLSEGYRLTWADWTETMTLGVVSLADFSASEYNSDAKITESKLTEVRYEDGGLQFEDYTDVVRNRRNIELYMGYIIAYSGTGTANTFLSTAKKRETVKDVERVSIFSSTGTIIGIFPSADVIPAYTRDRNNNALFIYKGNYYYLDSEQGVFVLSDYIDARDNRGLYYDYVPDFGTSDCNLNIYSNYETVTMNYRIDTYYYYSLFLIDWRIAREVYEVNPSFAEHVATRTAQGKYYNLPFSIYLRTAKDRIAYEAQFTEASVTTALTEPVQAEPSSATAVQTESSSVIGSTAAASSAVASSAVASSVAASSAVGSSAVGSSAVGSSAVGSSAVASSAVGSSAVGSSAVGSSAVGSSAVGSSAVGSSSVDSSAVTEPAETEKKDPDTVIYVSKQFDSYRFIYSTSKPAVKKGYNTEKTFGYYSYVKQTLTWDSQYRYAKAFNFREGRAVTVDDNGYLKVINNSNSVKAGSFYTYHENSIALDVTPYYTEPFYKDKSSVGHYYYDNGLLRVRKVQIQTYLPTIYYTDEDILIDYNGNEYEIPSGFSLVSYADGILVLEKNGLYGCYHKDGYWVAQPIYAGASAFIEGLCVLTLSDGTQGMIDTCGNIVIPFMYSSVSDASSGVIACYRPEDGWTLYAKMTK